MDESIAVMACFAYNAINAIVWGVLAGHFGHWWMALFAILTQISINMEREV